MTTRHMFWLAAGLVLALAAPLAAQSGVETAQSNAKIEEAIAQACDKLKEVQKDDGSWTDYRGYPGATTALAVQALLLAGEPYDSPCIKKAAVALTRIKITKTYAMACRAMAYALLVPHYPALKANLGQDAGWLAQNQHMSGMWGYVALSDKNSSWEDNSNTQFAVIGLRDASGAGVEVAETVWMRLLKHYTSTQLGDGGWTYKPPDPKVKEAAQGGSSVTITAPSLASLMIVNDELLKTAGCPCLDGRSRQGKLDEKYVDKGIQWLINYFGGQTGGEAAGDWGAYFHYGVQRAAQASGLKAFGKHDWYQRGSADMCGLASLKCIRPFNPGLDSPDTPANQGNPEFVPPHVVTRKEGGKEVKYVSDAGAIVGVSLATIFLVKGNAPVFMNKLMYPGDWNRHRRDLALMTGEMAKRLERPFRWQVVDVRSEVDTWRDAPLLYLSGENALPLADADKKKLADFCLKGGTLFIEANCGNIAFTEQVRALAKELWPAWPLERLPADHPIYRCQTEVQADGLLEGVSDGIRTLCFFTNKDFSCTWQMRDADKGKPKYDLALNMYQYATDKAPAPPRLVEIERRLEERRIALEEWKKAVDAERALARKEKRPARKIAKPGRTGYEQIEADFRLVKPGGKKLVNVNLLKHEGNSRAALHYPVMSNLIAQFQKRLGITLALGEEVGAREIDPGMPDVLVVRGDRAMNLKPDERAGLAKYLTGGGFVIAEAVLGHKEFDDDFRKLMAEAGLKLVPLPADDPFLMGDIDEGIDGIEVSACQFTRTIREEQPGIKTPIIFAIQSGTKTVGYYSPLDLTYSATGLAAYGLRGYDKDSALALLINMFLKTTKG